MHEFCTAPELNAHRQKGCERLIEIDSTVNGKSTDQRLVQSNAGNEFFISSQNDNKPSSQEKVKNTCEYCGRTFSYKSSLIAHQRNAHPSKRRYMYNCEECGERFQYRKQLFLHHRSLHVDANQRHPCTECGRTFSTRSYLIVHRRDIHAAEFKCDVCDKIFKVKSHRNKHRRKHEITVQQYACEHCDRKYCSKSVLLAHLHGVHLNGAPFRFKCDKCKKSYLFKSQLNSHRLRHSKKRLRPFECWLCHKA